MLTFVAASLFSLPLVAALALYSISGACMVLALAWRRFLADEYEDEINQWRDVGSSQLASATTPRRIG